MINLDLDLNSSVVTFGLEPKDFKELIKNLYTVRVSKAAKEDATKKRDLKAEAKDKAN